MKSRLRATFQAPHPKVDAENEVLHDVQITLEGEAKGHGVWLDREFCEAVAAAGNATGDVGLKVRYGHPAMCADAIGTELGRAKNFRVVDIDRQIDGQTVTAAGVIADIHILASAHHAPQGDIAAHVLAAAAEDPAIFGQSIVFTAADRVVKDAEGVRHSYNEEVLGNPADGAAEPTPPITEKAWFEKSADGKEYMVLGKLHGTDFTDEPAATDGVFSTGTLAEEAALMLDEHPQIVDAIEKNPNALVEFLDRANLLHLFENARIQSLQSAKDKEIAALKAKMNEMLASHDAAMSEALSERQALAGQIETLSAEIAEKAKALDAALSERSALAEKVEQLTAKYDEAAKALADTQAALAAETERYREQIGLALAPKNTTSLKGSALIRCTFAANK